MNEFNEISESIFSNNIEEIEKYDPGSKVSRENFTSMIVTSFYVSRGFVFRQDMFLKWVEAKTGFDYNKTIRNFFSAGGWDCLSGDEQEIFESAFMSVSKHAREGAAREFRENPNLAIKENLPTFFYEQNTLEAEEAKKDAVRFKKQYGELIKMNYQELVSNLNKFRK